MKNIFKKINYDNLPAYIRRFVNICVGFHPFGYPYKKLKIIGVTGTNGKTTTTTLLYKIATELGYKAGLIGTVENLVNGKKILTDFTTPEGWKLNKMLQEMARESCEYVFMEVSSHGMEERRVAGLKFTGAVFTNLTQDHLDYHKNMENYFLAKRKLFTMLPPTAFALSNVDDEYGKKIIEGIKARKFSYGFTPSAQKDSFGTSPLLRGRLSGGPDFHGEIKKSDFNGLELDFNPKSLPAGRQVKSKLLGKFNAYNLLAVWSTCKLLGFDMPARNASSIADAGGGKVKKIIENIEPPTGRFDHFMSKSGVLVIVDYAHTPDALEKVLLTIKELKPKEGRIISVFGCGGDRDPLKRPIMGKIGASLSDIVIFTSDNPRNEDPNKIIEQMKNGLTQEELKKVLTIVDRRLAIKEAVRIATESLPAGRQGDIVLCVGKGHENYQEIKGVKTHFNDTEELKKFFH